MNLTPGTSLWAIQQMLEGKKIRYKSWQAHDYIHVVDGYLVNHIGGNYSASAMESVSDDKGWLLWAPPNPYPKGTFAWAWEEVQRGNKVKRKYDDELEAYYWIEDKIIYKRFDFQDTLTVAFVPIDDINSTNWELVE